MNIKNLEIKLIYNKIYYFIYNTFNVFKPTVKFLKLGIGDWGLGIGDWGLGPIPNPQSPIPNPQSPLLKKIYY